MRRSLIFERVNGDLERLLRPEYPPKGLSEVCIQFRGLLRLVDSPKSFLPTRIPVIEYTGELRKEHGGEDPLK